MTSNISINLPVPSISKEKYIELTGLPEDTVDAMLKDGRLPRHRLRKDLGREKGHDQYRGADYRRSCGLQHRT